MTDELTAVVMHNSWLSYAATGSMLSTGTQDDPELPLQPLPSFAESSQLMPESTPSLHCCNGDYAHRPFFSSRFSILSSAITARSLSNSDFSSATR
jgi:hypothetical protein